MSNKKAKGHNPKQHQAKKTSSPTSRPLSSSSTSSVGNNKQPPKNFPPHIRYIAQYEWSPSVPQFLRRLVLNPTPSSSSEFLSSLPASISSQPLTLIKKDQSINLQPFQIDHILSQINQIPIIDIAHFDPPASTSGSTQSSPAKLKIAPVTDPKHPAFGQNCMIASKKLKPKQHLLDYVGVVHEEISVSRTSDYLLSFLNIPILQEPPGAGLELLKKEMEGSGSSPCTTSTSSSLSEVSAQQATETSSSEPPQPQNASSGPIYVTLSIDANNPGNEARMINDFRGIAKAPNVEFKLYRHPTNVAPKIRMGVFVLPGREIQAGEEILLSYGKGFWTARGLLRKD
jgi:hypothetical protein